MGTFEGFSAIGRTLLGIGAVLLLAGVLFILIDRVPLVGKLPGDIVYRRGGFTFYFPLVTCLIASALFSLVMWLLRK